MVSMEMLLAAFGGGVLGAAMGALPAFIFTGVIGLAGIAIVGAGGQPTILNNLAFGVLFGPHISFAGGVAAAAFAGNRKGYINSGMDIVTPLIKTNDAVVLLVGGVFGIGGLLLNLVFQQFKLPADTIAFTVVASAVCARFMLGGSGLFGTYAAQEAAATGEAASRSFFPDARTLAYTVVFAFGVGIVVSYLVALTKIAVLGFCISAATLLFLQMGFQFPVTHHITLVTGYATMATGNIYMGAVFAVIAALVGEIAGRTINSYCDTHIDPPATTIFLCSLFIFTFLS